MIPTVAPCRASAAARLVLTVDLPTPPLPAATAMVFFPPGRRGLSGRFARPRTFEVTFTSTPAIPGTRPTACSTARTISSFDGQTGVVSSRAIWARSPASSTAEIIPAETRSIFRAGSRTSARAAVMPAVISSTVGMREACRTCVPSARTIPFGTLEGSRAPRDGLRRAETRLRPTRSLRFSRACRGQRVQLAGLVGVVAHLAPLDRQVGGVVLVLSHPVREPRGDVHAGCAQPRHLERVVGQEANRTHFQVGQNRRRQIVTAGIGLEAERQVRLDGVGAAVLECVGADLVAEPDAAPLLPEVDDEAGPFGGDPLERGVELLPAVALERPDHLGGPALGVDTAEHVAGAGDVAAHDRHVLLDHGRLALGVRGVAINDQAEQPMRGGKLSVCVSNEAHSHQLDGRRGGTLLQSFARLRDFFLSVIL